MRVCIFIAQEESSCTNYIYYLTHKFPNDQRKSTRNDEKYVKNFPREKKILFLEFLELENF